jgi:heptosyltransferase III
LKILVLRGGALGDLILTLPALRQIRRAYPDARIELRGVLPQAKLAAPDYVDRVERVDAAELAPLFVDQELPQSLSYLLNRFDLAVSFFADSSSVITRNLIRVGVRTVVGGPKRSPTPTHAVYYLASVLEPLGLTLGNPVPALAVGPRPVRAARLAFHPGSGSPQKNWPVTRWVELIRQCESIFEDFLLLGGEADGDVVRAFVDQSNCRRLKTLLGADLVELSGALNACTAFAGHDTGVSHLAAAVGTPTVVLFGPTNPNVWAPLGRHVQVIRDPSGKMESIPVRDVVAALSDGSSAAGELS